MYRRSLAIAAVAFGATLALSLSAHAYPAETTGDLNVRTGPSVRLAHYVAPVPRYHHHHRRRMVRPYYRPEVYRRPYYGAPLYYGRPYGGPFARPYYYRRPGASFYFGTGFGPWMGF